MTTAAEDEFGELVDFNPEEMHGVGKAANGTSFLVAKSAAGGLLAPEQVRELVGGGADGREAFRPHAGDTITMSGSPGAIVNLMKEAATRRGVAALDIPAELDQVVKSAGDYAAVVKAKYSAEDKRKLLTRGHAMRNADGEPDYPIGDEEDLDKAIHAVGRGGADHDKIRKYVIGRAKALGKSNQIPDNWAADGSLKQPVSKADGEPGSPGWESQDAASAEAVVARILACIPAVRALAMREATEVGAGHTDDICDVITLQCAIDQLTEAAKNVGAFAVSEHAEAGETGPVTKAQPPAAPSAATAAPSPKENTVEQTTTEVAKAEDTAAAGTETATVSKAAALAQQLGISVEQLAELGAQHVLKAATDAAATQTPGAEAAPTDARTIPGTDTVQSPAPAKDEVSKAEANSLVTALSEVMAPVAKQLTELAAQVGTQGERVEKMAAQADNRRSPYLNGATGEAGPALREAMNASPEWQTVAKALDALPDGPAKDEAKRSVALQALAARFGG